MATKLPHDLALRASRHVASGSDLAPRASRLVPSVLRAGRFTLSLERPLIMGVVNVTPDSFSDGGRFFNAARAVAHARQLIDEGADILDIGGESTRPGAAPVSEAEEADRVLPVLDALADGPVPVSIDTRHPALMRVALERGASMINDVEAMTRPGALDALGDSGCAVCLMHMQGDPRTMQAAPAYADVVAEVETFLLARVAACEAAGVARERLVIDPGFGFGKSAKHNLDLLRALPRLAGHGMPVLAGLSRKSLLGRITGRAVDGRLAASVAAAMLAVERGAAIVRVHDVAATRDGLLVQQAVIDESFQP
jgi:dihydropteroate synthase